MYGHMADTASTLLSPSPTLQSLTLGVGIAICWISGRTPRDLYSSIDRGCDIKVSFHEEIKETFRAIIPAPLCPIKRASVFSMMRTFRPCLTRSRANTRPAGPAPTCSGVSILFSLKTHCTHDEYGGIYSCHCKSER